MQFLNKVNSFLNFVNYSYTIFLGIFPDLEYRSRFQFKACARYSSISPKGSLIRIMERDFYFTKNAVFVIKIFKFM